MSAHTTYADWIAIDWGTSNLRIWAMTADGEIRDTVTSSDGMSGTASGDFEATLLALVEPWLANEPMTVIACGMVGARQGWCEAPYQAVPSAPLTKTIHCPTADPRLNVHILPGLSQEKPPNVMRGEETQIAGFLSDQPNFDGILCMPGTHTKWAQISAGEIVSFQTTMTGEIFGLLSQNSVLRHSVESSQIDEGAFLDAVADTLSRPEFLSSRLFQIRAADLLENLSPSMSRARLSGALIGAELAATRAYWLGQNIAIIGAPHLTALYQTALKAQGLEPQTVTGDALSVKGLSRAYKELMS